MRENTYPHVTQRCRVEEVPDRRPTADAIVRITSTALARPASV